MSVPLVPITLTPRLTALILVVALIDWAINKTSHLAHKTGPT